MSVAIARMGRGLGLASFGIAMVALALPGGASAATPGSLTGTVTYGGAPVGQVAVYVETAGGSPVYNGETSNSTGSFTIPGVAPGTYYVYYDTSGAEDASGSAINVAQQWYGSPTGTAGLNEANAEAATVTAGDTTTLSPQALASGASITGIATDAVTQQPLTGEVTASDAAGDAIGPISFFATAAGSVAGGQYTISSLPPGAYYLNFYDNSFTPTAAGTPQDDSSGWWANATTLVNFLSEADAVVASAGATATANAAIPQPGSITGTVTAGGNPVAGVTVDVIDSDGQNLVDDSTQTGPDGSYDIAGLLPGSYKLGFVPGDSNLAVQYSGDSNTLAGATAETVTAGTATKPVNAALAVAGWVSGKVLTSAGTPLSHVEVELLDASGSELKGADTGPDGTYTISGVPAGRYYVEFDPSGATTTAAYQVQFYGGQQVLAGSIPIGVAAGAATSGIDAVLVLDTAPGLITTTMASVPTLTGSVSIGGTAKVGDTLGARLGNWVSGTSFVYQWYVNNKAIAGAGASTFTLTGADYRKTITVKVTGAKSGYNWSTVTSAATRAATAGTLKVRAPTISGTAAVGRTLAAKVTGWTAGTRFSYQWYAARRAIKGAVRSRLTLTTAEKGRVITIKVTGTLSGYTHAARTSRATRKVD